MQTASYQTNAEEKDYRLYYIDLLITQIEAFPDFNSGDTKMKIARYELVEAQRIDYFY